MTAREILITLHNRFNGDWDKIYDFISNRKDLGDIDLTNSENYITLLDEDYPVELKNTYRPPFVITKDQAKIKTYRVSFTYEFEAYTDAQAENKVRECDLDFDRIVKVSEVKQVI